MVYSAGAVPASGYSTGLRLMSEGRDFLGLRSWCFLVAFLFTCLASRELNGRGLGGGREKRAVSNGS